MALLPALLLWSGVAHAEPQLPSYREEVVVTLWMQVDAQITAACRWRDGQEGVGVPLACDEPALRAAIDHASGLRNLVVNDGRLAYLQGLAYRHLGDREAAILTLQDATRLSPERAEAWLDLGELLAGRERWDEARAAFEQVVARVPSGPRAWPGWLQLAQVDARQGRAEAFVEHCDRAIEHGLTAPVIAGQPAWKLFLADPKLHDAVERVALRLGGRELLATLTAR